MVQVCTEERPATDEELPSPYVEEFRYAFKVSWVEIIFYMANQESLFQIVKLVSHTVFFGRYALDAEILKYIGEAYPKGVCSVYCGNGKDVEGPGADFELVVVICASRHSPQNFWYDIS